MKTSPVTVFSPGWSSRRQALRRLLPVLLATVLGLQAAPQPGAVEVRQILASPSPYRTDRILVKPRPGVDLGVLNLQLGAIVLRTFPGLGNLQVLRVPAGSPILSLVSVYRQSGLVQYAEPDYLVHLLRAPNDFRYWDGSLWGLHNTGNLSGTPGADIKAPEAWDTQNTADNIVVAVVDTGVRATHEDIAANLWTNPGESGLDAQGHDKATNGIDDDGNGYVDDVHGINAITGSGNPADDFGHGTHVNGIIGGVGDNSVGVVGVAWRVQLMNCKFIDAQGNGAISDAITGIDYARRKGARLINASWGTVDFQSQALRDAITAARDTGMLFVAAAGNSTGDNDATPLYPASYDLDNIIAVASTNRQDSLSFFSNYGATTVDLAAPGEDIFSTWGGSDSDYQFESGTSMATAYVSGAAAILMAHAPNETYQTIRQRIIGNTDPLPALQGKVASGGRLNLFRALGGGVPPTVPAAPGNLVATATSTSGINLAWTDNALNEDGFKVERSTDNASFAEIASVAANVTTYADTGLTANTTYYYRVRAFNSAGNSGYSNTASARTSAPAGFTVTVAATDGSASESGDTGTFTVTRSGNGSLAPLTVSYTMSGTAQNGTDYQSLPGSVTIPDSATSATVMLTPIDDTLVEGNETAVLTLTGGSGYTVGSPASASIVLTDNDAPPPPRPNAPGNLSATAVSSSRINLTWTDNADNEQGFIVERSTDNASFTAIATLDHDTTAYGDLNLAANTTYYYRVAAFNNAGNSDYSNTASARTSAPPPMPPAAPGALSATATSSSAINLSWTDNADNEDGFRIERSADGASFTEIATVGANVTSYPNTGLTADTTYYYRVRAFNGAGNSGYSNTANAHTQAPPSLPVVTVTATDGTASETGPDTGTFAISRSGNTDTALTVRFTLGGGARNGIDYQTLPDSVTIPAGATSAQLTVTPIDDAEQEASETVELTLSASSTYTIGSPQADTVVILDNDTPPPPTVPAAPGNLSAAAASTSTINLAWTDNAGNEDGFRLERSTDNANFSEIATVGANVTGYSNTGLAADTTYYYRVRAFNGAGNSGYSNTASARTQSPPPPPEPATMTVIASDAVANEAGPSPGEFLITRSGDTGAALTVNYVLGGTATNGSDYQALGGVVTIPAGASSATVRVMPIDDRLIEVPELVTLTLAAGPGYHIGLPNLAVVTIVDNDVLPLPLF